MKMLLVEFLSKLSLNIYFNNKLKQSSNNLFLMMIIFNFVTKINL